MVTEFQTAPGLHSSAARSCFGSRGRSLPAKARARIEGLGKTDGVIWLCEGSTSFPALVSFAHTFQLLAIQKRLNFHPAAQVIEEPFVVVAADGLMRIRRSVPYSGLRVPDFVRKMDKFSNLIVARKKPVPL